MVVSVCAPAWNRQRALDRMIEQYGRLYSDLDIEISICDDGSRPPAKAPPHVIMTHLPQKSQPLNPCVPINHAVNASTGDIIVLTNPEIEHREPVLPAMLAMLESEMDYVTARCMDTSGVLLAGDGVDYTTHGRLPVPPGAHFHFLAIFHRSLWKRAGGFDEEYRMWSCCDDNDWLWRLWAVGARFKSCPATVWHERKTTPWVQPHAAPLFYKKWPQARKLA